MRVELWIEAKRGTAPGAELEDALRRFGVQVGDEINIGADRMRVTARAFHQWDVRSEPVLRIYTKTL